MKDCSRMVLMSNHMYCWSLVALLCVTIPIVNAADEKVVLNGRFETSDGSQCAWFELKLSPNKTAMGMACSCNKEPQGRQSYTCQYEVETIERCSEYQSHPRSFYNGLVKQITDNYTNGCAADDLISELCKAVPLKRVDLHKLDPESPCVPEKHKRTEL